MILQSPLVCPYWWLDWRRSSVCRVRCVYTNGEYQWGLCTTLFSDTHSPFVGNFANKQGQHYEQSPTAYAIGGPGQIEPLNGLRKIDEDPNALRILSFNYRIEHRMDKPFTTNHIGYCQTIERNLAPKAIHYVRVGKVTRYGAHTDDSTQPGCLMDINNKVQRRFTLRLQQGQHGWQPAQSNAMTVGNERNYKYWIRFKNCTQSKLLFQWCHRRSRGFGRNTPNTTNQIEIKIAWLIRLTYCAISVTLWKMRSEKYFI